MPDLAASMIVPQGGFEMQGMMMRYNLFMPRLFNWCLSMGFTPGRIVPSRAFCSDESQGYPIIMIAKHFGAFPFNHGRVGGIVATDRHGPHAAHGQDMVIIQASHVGYDPDTKEFGIYRRLQTTHEECGPSCGKVFHTIEWYDEEYQFARRNIMLQQRNGKPCLIVDNHLLRDDLQEGLLLRLDKLIESDGEGQRKATEILSTAKVFVAKPEFVREIGKEKFNSQNPVMIGDYLAADKFYYKRNITPVMESGHHLEQHLIKYMPQIVTSHSPTLTAAQINTQVEFDRTFRTIVKEHGYQGKKLLFISGLNIDISPQHGQLFPLTKFIPWAAYIQDTDGSFKTMEQREVFATLEKQEAANPHQIDLEAAIQTMIDAKEIKVEI